jgi:hypothetical protein
MGPERPLAQLLSLFISRGGPVHKLVPFVLHDTSGSVPREAKSSVVSFTHSSLVGGFAMHKLLFAALATAVALVLTAVPALADVGGGVY